MPSSASLDARDHGLVLGREQPRRLQRITAKSGVAEVPEGAAVLLALALGPCS